MSETQGWSNEQKKLVFNTVAKGLTAADQALFEAVCLSSGLDPLRKEIYAVQRGNKMSIQTGIDGYLKLANQTKELNGMEVLFYDEHGEGSEVWLKSDPPTACVVRVYRKGSDYPFTASCRFDAYTQSNHMWKKFPETMLAKATTTLALRRGFSDVISGIASADELGQADLAAPELLTQGTPEQTTPKGGTKAKSPATPKKAPAAGAAKGSDPVAVEVAAENLAKSTGGTVVEAPAEKKKKELGKEDLKAVAVEHGLTKHAIDGILELIKGDYSQGITTIKEKTEDQIAALNKRFAPATSDLSDW
tara:strand:- start:1336 stop:2250 length:915 start_codon:yes stop_codon:yes gene_type:complete